MPEKIRYRFLNSVISAQDIGRLPSGEEKVDCISVSFAPIRTEIELLNKKYWDALVSTLHVIISIVLMNKFAYV